MNKEIAKDLLGQAKVAGITSIVLAMVAIAFEVFNWHADLSHNLSLCALGCFAFGTVIKVLAGFISRD